MLRGVLNINYNTIVIAADINVKRRARILARQLT